MSKSKLHEKSAPANGTLGLCKSSITKMLLLPDSYNISSTNELLARMINSHPVFKKLYRVELDIQHILESLENNGLLISHDWVNSEVPNLKSVISNDTSKLNEMINGQGKSLDRKALLDYWLVNNLEATINRGSLSKLRKVDTSYDIMYRIKKQELFLKQWHTDMKLKSKQTTEGYLLKGSWQSFSSYTGRVNAKNMPLTSLPSIMRDYVLAPEGYRILSVDLNSAELRFLAYYSGCEKMLELLYSGEDLHTKNAELIMSSLSGRYVLSISQSRDLAKRYVFMLFYGASLTTIQKSLAKAFPGLTTADVQKIGVQFEKVYPELSRFLLLQESKEKVGTIYGDVHPIAEFTKQQKRNFQLQSSVAVVIKLLMVKLAENYQLIHVQHDEIWLKAPCRLPTKKIVAEITKDLEGIVQELLPGFPIENILTYKIIGGQYYENK